MNEKNQVPGEVTYPKQEERISTGSERENIYNEIKIQLNDVITCLNFCDYELGKIKNRIADKVHQLDVAKRITDAEYLEKTGEGLPPNSK